MLSRTSTTALALIGLITSSAPSSAMMGIGCPDLPSYARAQGTLQLGEGACNMTTAEAMRIVRRERPDLYGPETQVSTSRKSHRHHRTAQ